MESSVYTVYIKSKGIYKILQILLNFKVFFEKALYALINSKISINDSQHAYPNNIFKTIRWPGW